MPDIDENEQLYDYLDMLEIMKLIKDEMRDKLDKLVFLCYTEGLNGPLSRTVENLITGINTRIHEAQNV